VVCITEKETDGLHEVRGRNVVELYISAIFQLFFNGISSVQMLEAKDTHAFFSPKHS